MYGMGDDSHAHRPSRPGGRFRAREGEPRRGEAMDLEMRYDDWHGFPGHGRRHGGHDHPMEREEGRHEHARRGGHGPPHRRCSDGPRAAGGRRDEVGGRMGVYATGF